MAQRSKMSLHDDATYRQRIVSTTLNTEKEKLVHRTKTS
jgi:hypothetical protein